MAITNGTFDTNISGWTSTHDSSSYYNTSYATYWDNGKAHVRSGSRYGGGFEAYAYFYQRFLIEKPFLVFDIQPLIGGDANYSCDYDSTCGWTLKTDSNAIIGHGKPLTATTVTIDVTNYIGQYLTLTFAAGAARDYGDYYDLLVDNVMNLVGMKFDPICGDTGQHCATYLYIDGVFKGITPYTTMLSIGTHNYSLFKIGYSRFDNTLNITSTDIANAQTGISFEPTITPTVSINPIINPNFDTDLSGWVISGTTWDTGRAHLTNGNTIYQIFSVTDNQLQFDYETIGYAPTDSGLGYKLYIDDVQILDNRLPGNYGNPLYGTEKVYLGNYIGRTAKILFYEAYGWEGWIDNVTISHTAGIYNGTFTQGFTGWETSGEISIRNCGDWPARWGPPCSGTHAQVGINDGGTISQTFILDRCNLKFDWMSGYSQRYEIYSGSTLIISKSLSQDTEGTEIVDLTNYVGSTLKVSFISDQFLAIDNVTTITNPYDISVISYPSGAEIYLDNTDTGFITGDTPVTIDGQSEGSHTITLKLSSYVDYTETINIAKCQTTSITAVFAGCVTFITSPSGAEICVDNTDTGFVAPKTICYNVGETHTYILTLKDYRSLSGNITLSPDKGVLIDETLVYNTGNVRFNVIPDGSKIIIDGTDTGKVTPDVVNNLPIGYHSYEIRKDNYYSLTGNFRSIVDQEKLISESLQQVTGIENGTFDTDISGWTVTSSNLTTGYVEWVNGTAHLITNNIPITFSKDFVATEDYLIFNYYPPISLNTSCSIGWNVIVDPDTPGQATITSYCGWGRSSEHWGFFEVDLSSYKGRNIRLNFNLTGNKVFYIGGPAEAYLDNVGNVPITRSITFDTYCIKSPSCALNPIVNRCSADISLDGNYIGPSPIQVDSISLGTHSYIEKNKGYISVDTNTEDTTGTLSFSQGIPTHFYIDGLYIPSIIPPLPPGEGCIYIESIPVGAEIFIDGIDSGKITTDTICNLSLTNHIYELKLLNHTVYKGSFTLYPGFGEYISVVITGSVYFTSLPGGAEIFLDGNDLGIKTPSLVNNIPAGNHTFTLKLPYYLDYTSTIYVIGEQK